MTQTLAELAEQMKELEQSYKEQMEEYWGQIPALLRQEREQVGLTQAQLGELVGIGHSMFSFVEMEKNRFSLDRLAEVAGELKQVAEVYLYIFEAVINRGHSVDEMKECFDKIEESIYEQFPDLKLTPDMIAGISQAVRRDIKKIREEKNNENDPG